MAKAVKIIKKWDESPMAEFLGAMSVFGLFFGFLLLPLVF